MSPAPRARERSVEAHVTACHLNHIHVFTVDVGQCPLPRVRQFLGQGPRECHDIGTMGLWPRYLLHL